MPGKKCSDLPCPYLNPHEIFLVVNFNPYIPFLTKSKLRGFGY
jgi:hypothetical protein